MVVFHFALSKSPRFKVIRIIARGWGGLGLGDDGYYRRGAKFGLGEDVGVEVMKREEERRRRATKETW